MENSLVGGQFLVLVAREITLNNDISIETHTDESIDRISLLFRDGDSDLSIRSSCAFASSSFRSAELIHQLIVHSLHLVRSSFESLLQELHEFSLVLIDQLSNPKLSQLFDAKEQRRGRTCKSWGLL